jgi:DNA-directed RNA polymerase specialized sigma24 family protein
VFFDCLSSNKQGTTAMTQLTLPTLKELISQVLEDAFQATKEDYPDELPAEPTEDNQQPPEDLSESKESIDSKLIRVLNKLPKERRMAIFKRFGMHTQQSLLRSINNVQKASKGSL